MNDTEEKLAENTTDGELNEAEVNTAEAEADGVGAAEDGDSLSDCEAGPVCEIDYAELEKADIAELKSLYPELSHLKSVTQLDNPLRYAALRDLGLTPKEAYLATQKRSVRYDNRSHLVSSVPRGAKSGGISMSPESLSEARELFSDLSDGEIQRLYKRVIK